MLDRNAPPYLSAALWRGLKGRCPSCGDGKLLHSYLSVTPHCPSCGEPYGHLRADDMPPWLTVFVVAHLVIPPMLYLEQLYQPNVWAQAIGWSVLSLALTLALLPRAKGAVLALMWSLKSEGTERG
ncbi:hypothetical protein AUP43_13865 [Oceanibaculum pacificum]|uniref:Zinc-finger protein n=2 Tax=Oceanibaculum pacificum TaxID=580166 RepID=A0A154VIV2_9PROT|nr:hypothetical protein AUP43_13865 [Oceanibaculum pacificum]